MLVSNTKSYSIDALKILVLGESGVGKTKLAATIGEPTLIISAEAGLLCLADSGIDVIDISRDDKGKVIPCELRINRLREAYVYLLSEEAKSKYKWIYIDSLTEISQNLVEQLQKEFPDRKDALVLWGEYATKQKAIIKLFRDIPFYNVVFTSLITSNQDEQQRRYLGVDVAGKISHRIPALLDIVLFMQAIQQEDGSVKRVLATVKNDRYVAKDRSGKLNAYEPADLSVIVNKIRGVKKMFDLSGFDASRTDFEILPEDQYKVQCTDVVLKDTKKGDGKYIFVTLEVISDPKFNGRKIFHNFNVVNPNPKAVEIGMKQLKSFLTCCKFSNPNKLERIDDLVGLRCYAKTRVKKDAEYGDKAEVHYFIEDKKVMAELGDIGF